MIEPGGVGDGSRGVEKAAEASWQSERRFRSLFENMRNGLAYCRMVFEEDEPRDFIYLEVNNAFETLTGLKDVIGKRASEVIPGIRELDPEVFEIYGRVARTGESHTFETYVAALEMWFAVSAYSPGAGHFVAVFDVITERKRMEEALRERAAKLDALFAILPVGISVLDSNRNMFLVNRALTTILGRSETSLLGSADHDGEFLNADGEPLPEEELPASRAFAESLEIRDAETGLVRDDGSVTWVSTSAVPVEFSDWKVVVVTSDITARKRAEIALEKLNANLEEQVAQRTAQLEAANKELQAFSYSVAHDLRAPLRGIDGWSHALLEDFGDRLSGDARTYLDRIRGEVQRMGELIDDLLALSRLTVAAMNKEEVDLSSMARSIAARLSEREPHRRVELVVEDGLSAFCDRRLLDGTLENLLGNAFKFTGKTPDPRIEFGKSETDGVHVFHVRDNGAGFDMTHAGRLFTAFQRLHRASEFPGTGVGLATVERVIQRHGGRVWAEAAPGRGATFYFTLEEGQ